MKTAAQFRTIFAEYEGKDRRIARNIKPFDVEKYKGDVSFWLDEQLKPSLKKIAGRLNDYAELLYMGNIFLRKGVSMQKIKLTEDIIVA